MKHLVVVRHGESVWNAEGRIQGQSCAGLSTTGRAQATQVARSLALRHPGARLVCSDLQRTVETAEPMADALGAELHLDDRLRERRFGAWEGRLRDEVIREDQVRWDRWLDGEDVVAEVGGETADELARRAVGVFEDLLERTDDGGVTIAVSHGGTIWHGVHTLLGLPIPSLGGVANASVATVVHWDDRGGLALDRWNEVAHLDLATVPDDRETSDAPPVGR